MVLSSSAGVPPSWYTSYLYLTLLRIVFLRASSRSGGRGGVRQTHEIDIIRNRCCKDGVSALRVGMWGTVGIKIP